jgi:hypothetical protein
VIDATVRLAPIEGGCWALVIDPTEGSTVAPGWYQPLALREEFRHEGLRVRAAVRIRSDFQSVCMIGPIVEVVWIQTR